MPQMPAKKSVLIHADFTLALHLHQSSVYSSKSWQPPDWVWLLDRALPSELEEHPLAQVLCYTSSDGSSWIGQGSIVNYIIFSNHFQAFIFMTLKMSKTHCNYATQKNNQKNKK